MADSITFTDPKTNAEYTLEYDRDSVRFAESIGLNLAVLSDRKRMARRDVPIGTLMSQVFYSALIKHHPMLTQDESDDIWERVTGKEAVFAALLDMIQVPYVSLLEEPGDADPKETVTIKLPKRAASARAK